MKNKWLTQTQKLEAHCTRRDHNGSCIPEILKYLGRKDQSTQMPDLPWQPPWRRRQTIWQSPDSTMGPSNETIDYPNFRKSHKIIQESCRERKGLPDDDRPRIAKQQLGRGPCLHRGIPRRLLISNLEDSTEAIDRHSKRIEECSPQHNGWNSPKRSQLGIPHGLDYEFGLTSTPDGQ